MPTTPPPNKYMQALKTPPSNPEPGSMYFDLNNHNLMVYDGTQWELSIPVSEEMLWNEVLIIESNKAEEARNG